MIIALIGPSGIGKGFIRDGLLKQYPHMEEISWVTTRALRPGEMGGNRIHVELHDFDHMVRSGELVLVQELYGNWYGMMRKDAIPNNRLRITEFHPDNIEPALRINPGIILIGFFTTNVTLLSERMIIREGADKTSQVKKRSEAAQAEISIITRLAHLYRAIIEVEKETEAQILDRVLQILNPILKGGSNA
jgi:guanylate kinase